MGIDVSKMSAEQLKIYNEAVRTGDTKALKELGFTETEAESLTEGISTKGLKPGDETSFSTQKAVVPEKEESSFWGNALKIGGAVLGAGLMGVAAFATKGKVKVPAGLLKTIGLGVVGTATAVGLSSCQGDTIINQEVGIDIKQANSAKEIIDWLEAHGYGDFDPRTIVKLLVANGKKDDIIIEVLTQMGFDLDEIKKILAEINAKLDDLKDEVMQNNAISKEIKDILIRITTQVGELSNITGKNHQLLKEILNQLNNIQQGDDAKMELLQAILAKLEVLIQNGDRLDDNDKNIQALLGNILAAITKMDNDMKSGFVAILTKLEQLKQQDKAKYDEIIKLLNTMLAKMDNLDDTMKAGFGAVLGKLDILDDHQTNYFKEILDKLDTMKENDKIFYAEILKRLDKLNGTTLEILKRLINIENITAANYNAIIAILDKLDKLGGQGDRILEILVNIGSSGGNVDLSEIKELLQILIEQGKTNGEILTSIDNKINLMLVVVEGMNKNLGGKLDTIIEKLKALLGKECNHDDLINILIEIKTIIQNEGGSGNGNNEGILDDLEDLLG